MAVWAEITLKPWGQHGELGTGKTHVEVDVRRREQRGARVCPGNPDYLADKPPLSPDPGSNHPLYHVALLSSLQDPRVPLPFISGHALSLPYFGSY
uniref:Uncharacterized protein n=1 Tax=Oryza nivara TaxID=4536 RepID=A0A0E0GQ50_ORYNI